MIYACVFVKSKYSVHAHKEGTVLPDSMTAQVVIHKPEAKEQEAEQITLTLKLAKVAGHTIPIYIDEKDGVPNEETLLAAAFDWYSWHVLDRNLQSVAAEMNESKLLVHPASVIPLSARPPRSSNR